MKLYACCQYCGKDWIEDVYSEAYLADKRCAVCKDRKIRYKKVEDSTIDTYVGCPEFPPKGVPKTSHKEDKLATPPYWSPDYWGGD